MPDASATRTTRRRSARLGAPAVLNSAHKIGRGTRDTEMRADHPRPGSPLSVIPGGRSAAVFDGSAAAQRRVASSGPQSTRPLWTALAVARSGLDPVALRAAENDLVAAYSWLSRPLAQTSTPAISSTGVAEAGLRKAIRSWQRPSQPWGFEEYARGAIQAEMLHASEPRRSWTHPARVAGRP